MWESETGEVEDINWDVSLDDENEKESNTSSEQQPAAPIHGTLPF